MSAMSAMSAVSAMCAVSAVSAVSAMSAVRAISAMSAVSAAQRPARRPAPRGLPLRAPGACRGMAREGAGGATPVAVIAPAWRPPRTASRAAPARWLAVAALALLTLTGCATRVLAPAAPPATATVAQAAWARVLERFVDARGAVDFSALAQDRADLDRYVRFVADTPLATLPAGDAKLAHLINAYNALSMWNVIESGIPATHAGLNKVGFFVQRKLPIGGESLSLYGFENDVIRPYTRAVGEPRVHFALNCSAVACPALPRTPFVAERLQAQLEREARAFFARPENFRIDAAARTVWLSEILDFYTQDFVPEHGRNLIDYANRHVATPAPIDYGVRFTPYDWTVANRRR